MNMVLELSNGDEFFYFIDYTKAFDYVDQINCGKFFRRWEYQTILSTSWEGVQVKKKQLKLDMEQTGSKLGEEYIKAVYCHPAYLTYMQSTPCKMPGRMKHKLGLRFPGEIAITSDMQIAESKEELKSLLMKVKDESEKASLKLNIQKMKIMASGPITSWPIDGETMEIVTDFIFGGSRITAYCDCSHKIKRCLLLGRIYDQPRQDIKKQRLYQQRSI